MPSSFNWKYNFLDNSEKVPFVSKQIELFRKYKISNKNTISSTSEKVHLMSFRVKFGEMIANTWTEWTKWTINYNIFLAQLKIN